MRKSSLLPLLLNFTTLCLIPFWCNGAATMERSVQRQQGVYGEPQQFETQQSLYSPEGDTSWFVIASISQQVSCEGKMDGILDAVVIGPEGEYSFEWNTFPAQHSAKAKQLASGQYQVKVTDQWGKVKYASIDLTAQRSLSFTANVLSEAGFEGNKGSAEIRLPQSTKSQKLEVTWHTIPQQNSHIAYGLEAGIHTVTVKDEAGCEATEAVTITGNEIFSFDDQSRQLRNAFERLGVSLYPNPVADNVVHLELPHDLTEEYQISVLSISGQEVYRQRSKNLYHSIPVSGLADGVYIVEIKLSNGEAFHDQLVVR